MTDEEATMTDEEAKKIAERAAAALPGPWLYEGALLYEGARVVKTRPDGGHDLIAVVDAIIDEQEEATAKFIAHAREDIPALLAERERLISDAEKRFALGEHLSEAIAQVRWALGRFEHLRHLLGSGHPTYEMYTALTADTQRLREWLKK